MFQVVVSRSEELCPRLRRRCKPAVAERLQVDQCLGRTLVPDRGTTFVEDHRIRAPGSERECGHDPARRRRARVGHGQLREVERQAAEEVALDGRAALQLDRDRRIVTRRDAEVARADGNASHASGHAGKQIEMERQLIGPLDRTLDGVVDVVDPELRIRVRAIEPKLLGERPGGRGDDSEQIDDQVGRRCGEHAHAAVDAQLDVDEVGRLDNRREVQGRRGRHRAALAWEDPDVAGTDTVGCDDVEYHRGRLRIVRSTRHRSERTDFAGPDRCGPAARTVTAVDEPFAVERTERPRRPERRCRRVVAGDVDDEMRVHQRLDAHLPPRRAALTESDDRGDGSILDGDHVEVRREWRRTAARECDQPAR